MALDQSQRWLFAINTGSDEIVVFAVRPTGLSHVHTVHSGGFRPISLTVFGKLLYVLNAGDSDNLTGFLIAADGRLLPLPHSTRRLSGDVTDPAQIAFTPDGTTLIVTEKATNRLDTYRVSKLGLASGPDVHDAPGSTPFGFAFRKRSHMLVSEAFAGVPDGSALSSFTVDRRGRLQVISPSIGTNQTAACWVVVTNAGRFAFVTNTGSGTISSYRIAFDGSLTLLDSVAATTAGSVIDLALSNDGRYLYSLSGARGMIDAIEVNLDGTLTPLLSVGGLPSGANGMAAR